MLLLYRGALKNSGTAGTMKSFKNENVRPSFKDGQTNRINTLMERLGTYKIRSHCLFCAFGLRARRGHGIPTTCLRDGMRVRGRGPLSGQAGAALRIGALEGVHL